MAHVSISTINRTVKKKGFGGYGEFKFSIKKDALPQVSGFSKEVLGAIAKNEEELLKTINNISSSQIEAAVKKIDESDEIILFARGLSVNAANEMMKKLQLWHKRVSLYDEDRTMKYFSRFVSKKTLVIAISLFGESRALNESVILSKKNGATILVLSASESSTLSQSADIALIGYKSQVEVNYFDLDVHSRLPLYLLVRILFDSYSIYKNK